MLGFVASLLTLTLGFSILRRPTSCIHAVDSRRARWLIGVRRAIATHNGYMLFLCRDNAREMIDSD
jgi:hypothetical protein